MIFTDREVLTHELMTIGSENFFLKHILDGESNFFHQNEPLDEFKWKKKIAECFNVNIRDIVIVGSGKLGFSVKPQSGGYLLNCFDSKGVGTSDLDIGVINSDIFDLQMRNIYYFTNAYRDKSLFLRTIDGDEVNTYDEYAKYVLKGWIRPDKMPKNFNFGFHMKRDCTQILKEDFRKQYNRKVSFGIYKSWFYFQDYQVKNLDGLRNTLIASK